MAPTNGPAWVTRCPAATRSTSSSAPPPAGSERLSRGHGSGRFAGPFPIGVSFLGGGSGRRPCCRSRTRSSAAPGGGGCRRSSPTIRSVTLGRAAAHGFTTITHSPTESVARLGGWLSGPVCCSTCARRTREPAPSLRGLRPARHGRRHGRVRRRRGAVVAGDPDLLRETRAANATLQDLLGGAAARAALGGQVKPADEGPEFGPALVAKRDVSAGDPLFGPVPFTPDVLQWHWDEITARCRPGRRCWRPPAGTRTRPSGSARPREACSSTSRTRRRRWCGPGRVRPGPAGRRGVGRRRRAGPLGPGAVHADLERSGGLAARFAELVRARS